MDEEEYIMRTLPSFAIINPTISIVERCVDGSMGLFEWLFWCKTPVGLVILILFICVYAVLYIAVGMVGDLVEDYMRKRLRKTRQHNG